MSVESMAIALHHSRAKGATKLILIGIANHDGDGGAWPALQTLMKYAGITDRRGAQRALRQLESFGEIRCYVSQGGSHSTADYLRPNLYKFTLACPHDCDHSSNHKTRRDAEIQAELEIEDPAVQRPLGRPAVQRPPGGAQTAGPRGARTAQTISNNHLSLVKEINHGTRAEDQEVALSRADIHVASNDDYQRELRLKCPMRRDGLKHRWLTESCSYCGIRRDQYWRGKEIITDPEWSYS